MNGNKYLLDTNIVLYLLGGKISNKEIREGEYLVSFVTELELLSYPNISETEENSIRDFLDNIRVVNITPQIKEQTIFFRKKYKLKLPDAIISATAFFSNAELVTNDKSLSKILEIKTRIIS